jgi:hemerythrin-like metal-binding protein
MGASETGPWREELAQIAEQHEELQRRTQVFLERLSSRAPTAELVRALRDLLELLDLHFRCEEQLMGRADYPEQHSHRLLHQASLQQFQAELRTLELGTRRPLGEYREMIQVWIQDHLDRQDHRFDAFLKRKLSS